MTKAVERALLALAARGKAGAVAAVQLDQWRIRGGGGAAPEVPGRDDVYRELWEGGARAVDAVVESLGHGFLCIRRGDRRTVVWNQHVPLDDPVRLRMAAHKSASWSLLRSAGIPVPDQHGYDLGSTGSARAFLAAGAGPCVVKPAADTGAGAGVTCGVRTDDELARASVRAARWSRSLLVQRQVVGQELRLLVLDGEVIGALARRPPAVTGDGRSTVADLVAAENVRRVAARGRQGLWPVALDLDAALALRGQGLTPRAVPRPGQEVLVGTTANENGPAGNRTYHPPPPVSALAVHAAGVFGLRLASVEVVVADLDSTDGVVLEVNGTPGLHYHAQVADPSTVVDVTVPILDLLLGSR